LPVYKQEQEELNKMKINTYQFIRKLHLYIAFSVLGFVFMYFVSGFILIHENWFLQSRPKTTSQQYAVRIPDTTSNDKIAAYLEKKFNIHAKRQRTGKHNDGSLYFEYIKPGGTYAVTVSPDKLQASLKIIKFTAPGIMVGFHRIHEYGGGWLYDIYVLMMDLASIATILFGLTGLYLWYKLMWKKKRWGIIILSLSIGYTITVIAFFMNR